MDRWLLDAAASGGHAAEVQHLLASHDSAVLLGTTPQGNTCLHIASIKGHEGFCKDVLALDQSLPLLAAINADGETPLLTTVARGRAALASDLLRCCRDRQLSEAILKQDKRGCNALHYAIRGGHRMLALELIEAEPALSKAVNKRNESPMFIAAMRSFTDVFHKLLEVPDSAHSGVCGFNALHAVVTSGNLVIAKRIMQTRPWLVRQENESKHTPMHLAANEDKVDVLAVLLEHDPSLGYLISTDGAPLLCSAASKGHVGVARELLRQCPDAPYCGAAGSTCFHISVLSGQAEFVEFVLGFQQLQHLINMADYNGETALPLAARNCEANMVAAFLRHQDIDVTVLDNAGNQAKALISVAEDAAPTTSSSQGATTNSSGTSAMDRRLEAAASGHAAEMKHLALRLPGVLFGKTPQGNTCLHISAMHGHEGFCKDALALNPSLLAAVNSDGETPLLIAVASGCVSVAPVLLSCCRDQQLSEAILKQDNRGCNALHHAVHSGHRELALELMEAEPALSCAANQYGESLMFIAVMRNYADVFKQLLEIPNSAYGGSNGFNALDAAVRNSNSAIAKKIMETRPGMAEKESNGANTPMQLVVLWDKIDVLRVLLEHDRSLGYAVTDDGTPLLNSAAHRGHVGVARELLKHCPDAPYRNANGLTCLHLAVWFEQTEFVEFVLGSQQLRRFVNMRDSDGNTALHLAVRKCIPKMVAALLLHQDICLTTMETMQTGY